MAMQTYRFEYTDTYGGEANYCWVRRGIVTVPELTRYGYDGTQGYPAAYKRRARHITRLVKACLGISGLRGKRSDYGDMTRIDFPGTVLFIEYCEES
jgi:hypothetical protein